MGIGCLLSPLLRGERWLCWGLSTKACRNCNNIGIAQIIAASWSNNHGLPETPLSTTTIVDVTATVVIPIEGDVATLAGGNGTSVPSFAASLSLDGSLAVHAGERAGRSITTDAITTPIVNTFCHAPDPILRD